MRLYASLCVTHNCNLQCHYCYQKHNNNDSMSFETAIKCVDMIFNYVKDDIDSIYLDFFGGEPLLEFELIKSIYEYMQITAGILGCTCMFFASTNGTCLNDEMRDWFRIRKNNFILTLSLDGSKETHNLNRNNSFNDIDIDYFVENYAQQGVKMTLSEHSLPNLAKDIKYIHSLGFKRIGGVNLAEGPFDFGKEEFVKILIPQLTEIVDFYVENPDVQINQMLDKYLHLCETYAHENEKRCGIGDRVIFFDTDGSRYPCPFVTPMIFSKEKIAEICRTNFSNSNCFLDVECDSNCYISSICPSCAASNYLNNNSFAIRDKRHCRIYKLIALFTADLNAKLISKYPNMVDDNFIYYTILAINKIKEIYLPEFMEYF